MAFLDKAGPDWDIAVAVVKKARQLQMDQRREEIRVLIEGIGISTGNRVGSVLAKAFG
jgi:hypothetical protein